MFSLFRNRKKTVDMPFYKPRIGSKIKNNPFSPQIDFTEKTKSYVCIE